MKRVFIVLSFIGFGVQASAQGGPQVNCKGLASMPLHASTVEAPPKASNTKSAKKSGVKAKAGNL